MKKIQIILSALIVLSVAIILLISPSNAISQKQSTWTAMPDNVKEILKNSCAACHNTGGKEFAIFHWSLSEWESYSVKKQAKKAKSICKTITDGSMPPSSVRTATPGKVPTTAQTEIICNWAKSLPKK